MCTGVSTSDNLSRSTAGIFDPGMGPLRMFTLRVNEMKVALRCGGNDLKSQNLFRTDSSRRVRIPGALEGRDRTE
jgi:hypothetical protein